MTPFFTSLAMSLVLAQPGATSWGLSWQAPAGCSDGADVRRAVETRLRRPVFGGEPTLVVDGVVERSEPGWRAHLTLRDATGALLGTRDVSSAEPECPSLDSRVTLVVALLIDPTASLRPTIVKQADAPALPPLDAAAAEARRAQANAPAPGQVPVEFAADDASLELYRLVQGPMSPNRAQADSGYLQVCHGPCSVLLPSADLYVVGGIGLRWSGTFLLPAGRAVRVDAKAGSIGALAAAVVLTTLGTAALIGGSIGAVFAANDYGENGPTFFGLTLGAAIAGAAALVGGLALGIGTSTSVQVTATP